MSDDYWSAIRLAGYSAVGLLFFLAVAGVSNSKHMRNNNLHNKSGDYSLRMVGDRQVFSCPLVGRPYLHCDMCLTYIYEGWGSEVSNTKIDTTERKVK